MRRKQRFGGSWTIDKLDRLDKYLKAYLTIFDKNSNARFYQTVYVDAFAGTGYIEKKSATEPSLFAELVDSEAQASFKGSVQRVLSLDPSFDRYLFIERSKSSVQELEQLRDAHPELAGRVQIEHAEANQFLKHWCGVTDWNKTRAVLFLDPFGMEVEWSLLKTIAATGGVDLWLLFPFGGVSRHLTRGEPPPSDWADRLTKVLGTDEWRQEFYPAKTVLTLFGAEQQQAKDTDFNRLSDYVVQRLKTLFAGVADNPLPLRNSRNTVLFLFCFATANEKPSPKNTALKIAQHILKG